VKGVVDGFATALMKMTHIGDHWMVYMPYTLGYGSSQSSSSTIPAYSMLKFEIVLKGWYTDGKWIKK
jgi:FKBP-type peptidyl-prolyl cis-trans isomerase FklB